MRFILCASILSLSISFLSTQAMQLETSSDAQKAPLQHSVVRDSDEITRARISEDLRKYGNGLYSLGRMQGMNAMSCINTVIASIEGKTEIPEDVRQEHVVNWLREAVEDEKDLASLYRLYTITGADRALWDSIQKAQIDLVALADNTHELQVKRDIVSLLISYKQQVPNRLLEALGLRRVSYGCGHQLGNKY